MPFLYPGKLLLPPWTPLPHAATRLRAGASQMGPGETQALPPRSLHPEASPSFSGDRSLSTTPVLPLPLRQRIQTGIVWGNTKQGQQATSLLTVWAWRQSKLLASRELLWPLLGPGPRDTPPYP